MEKIHEGHQGMEKCRSRIMTSVWWPFVNHQITQFVEQCHACSKARVYRKEPLCINPLPTYPWQMVGTDLFELKGTHYLLTVDYFSRYPEVTKLSTTTSSAVISSRL